MGRGLLGSIVAYDEMTFKTSLEEGFTLGTFECRALQYSTASGDTETLRKDRLHEMKQRLARSDIVSELPDNDNVWLFDNHADQRIRSMKNMGQGQGHCSYFMIGIAAGLHYGGSPDEEVQARVYKVNTVLRNAQMKAEPFAQDLLAIEVQGRRPDDYLRVLKDLLYSCHAHEKILVLSACPNGQRKIRSDREFRAIQDKITHSTHKDNITLESIVSCDLAQMTIALRKFQPTILHFSGHANTESLCFEDSKGNLKSISIKSLMVTMGLASKAGLHTVVLSACYTAEQSDCIANVVGQVIGMKDVLYDEEAKNFSAALYEGIGQGHGIHEAFDWALMDPQVVGIPPERRPLLIRAGSRLKAPEVSIHLDSLQTISDDGLQLASSEDDQVTTFEKGEGRNIPQPCGEANECVGEHEKPNEEKSNEHKPNGPKLNEPNANEHKSSELEEANDHKPSEQEEATEYNDSSEHEDSTDHNEPSVQEETSVPHAIAQLSISPESGKSPLVNDTVPEEVAQSSTRTRKEQTTASVQPVKPIDHMPAAVSSPHNGLTMIERLKLTSRLNQQETPNTKKPELNMAEATSSVQSVPNGNLSKSGKSEVETSETRSATRAAPNIVPQVPPGTGQVPRSRTTTAPTPSQAKSSTLPNAQGRDFFARDSMMTDPFFAHFFAQSSLFDSLMRDLFGGTGFSRPTPSRPRPPTQPSAPAAQPTVRPQASPQPRRLLRCNIQGCGKLITAQGITCETCTGCKQVACLDCARRLACVDQQHKLFRVSLQGDEAAANRFSAEHNAPKSLNTSKTWQSDSDGSNPLTSADGAMIHGKQDLLSISDATKAAPDIALNMSERDLAIQNSGVDDKAQCIPTRTVEEVSLGLHNLAETSRIGGDMLDFAESTLIDDEAVMSIEEPPVVSGGPNLDQGVQSETTKVKQDELSTTLLTLVPREEFDDTDIRSLVSEGDDGASQASSSLPALGLETENAIVYVLAKSSLLTPLYGRALQLLPKERFINNFRRLLRVFHTDLTGELQEPLVTRQLSAILRSKERRGRMAQKIVLKYLSDVEASSLQDDLAPLEGQDNHNYARIEGWLKKQHIPSSNVDDQQDDVPDVNNEHTVHESEKDNSDNDDQSETDTEDEDSSLHGEFANHPRLDMVMKTLVKGRPFQDLIVGMKELLLPSGLLDDILPIPRANIHYDPKQETSILNSIQVFIEDITALPWDWWPLPPKMRKIRPDETRVHWRCVSITTVKQSICKY